MRITNSMITSQYKRNLNQSLNKLNYYNQRATTLRKFDSVSDNPVAASKAYSLRRAFNSNSDYMSNLENVENMMLTAESSMTNLNKIAQEVGSSDILQSVNGTMSKEDRSIIATKIRKMQDAMVAEMNTKYGDQFLFSGNDNGKPPFTIGQDGALLYKGVNVTTGKHAGFEGVGSKTILKGSEIDFGKENSDVLNGFTINVNKAPGTDSFDEDSKVINVYLSDANLNTANLENSLKTLLGGQTINGTSIDGDKIKVSGNITGFGTAEITGGEKPVAAGTQYDLNQLSNEKRFIDIGLGLSLNNNGTLNEQSMFNASLPGISFLGFGDNNGVPNNMYELLGKIADGLESPDYNYDNVKPFIDNFRTKSQDLLGKITEFGSKSNFLEFTTTRLKDAEYNLNVKIKNVEFLEPQDAILDFKMQQYSYMAALQMGTKLIQPSFLDFMR